MSVNIYYQFYVKKKKLLGATMETLKKIVFSKRVELYALKCVLNRTLHSEFKLKKKEERNSRTFDKCFYTPVGPPNKIQNKLLKNVY